jgi:multidrug resistance protein, MATE family
VIVLELKLLAVADTVINNLSEELIKTFKLGWPIMCAQMLWLSLYVADNMMVANLGKEPLAAMAMAGTVASFMNVSLVGIMAALSPIISQAFGANDKSKISDTIRQSMVLAIFLSGIEIIILYFSEPILNIAGQDPSLTPLAQIYLRSLIWGVPGSIIFVCLRHFTEGIGDTIPALVIIGIGSLSNIGLNYVLMYGYLGFPAMGLIGAGFSTSITHILIAIVLLLYIKFKPSYGVYGAFAGPFKINFDTIYEILRLGIPMGAAIMSEMAFFISTTIMAGVLGIIPLGSHQIALNAASFTFMIPLGLSFAVSIRIGHAVGRNDKEGVKRAGIAGIIWSLTINSITAIVFLFFPEKVVGFYTQDPELSELAVTLLRIGGIFQLFDGIQVVGMGMLRGLKETKAPFMNTMFSFWCVGFPTALFITFKTDFGAVGLWWGMVMGLGLAGLCHQIRFYKVYKRLK